MKYKLWFLSLLFAVVVVVACSDDTQQPSDSRARISFREDSLITMESVYVTMKAGGASWSFQPQNFQRDDADTTLFLAPEVKTSDSGTLNVTIRLVTPGGVEYSDGSLTAALSPNWRWNFEIVHALTDPAVDCSNCVGSSQFEIKEQGLADGFIYVLWRGSGP